MITIWLATVICDGMIVAEFVTGSEDEARDLVLDWARNEPAVQEYLDGSIDDADENAWSDAVGEAGYDVHVRSIIDISPDGRG
jgi:hypothetical protein